MLFYLLSVALFFPLFLDVFYNNLKIYISFPSSCTLFAVQFSVFTCSSIYLFIYAFLPEVYLKLRQAHLENAALERKKFRHHTDKCKNRNSDKSMGMIFDGMTQDTTALPHFIRKPGWQQRNKYGVHVQGVMVAGRRPRLEFAYGNVANDSNMAITTIHNAILAEQKCRSEEGRPLPEVLYIQADNVNSNKSKVLMGYLCHLVNLGVFTKIKVNFLLVGHTHENIDQMFSRFSIALRQKECLTLDELMEVAKNSLQQQPEVVKVEASFNWQSWVQQTLHDFQDISYNHAFKVQKVDGKAKLFSRQFGAGPSRTWQANALDILPEAPIGEPDVAPLKELGEEDMKSLEFLRDKLRETLYDDAHKQDVVEYWNSQLHFQRNVSQESLVELPFTFPEPSTYVAPAAITVQEALAAVGPQLRTLVNPEPRPAYLGSRNPVTRAAVETIEDDRYAEAMETIKDFDPNVHGDQLVISWAEGIAKDPCWFKVKYRANNQWILSLPLHLATVESIDAERNTICWRFLMPTRWSIKEDRFIGPQNLAKRDAFSPAGSIDAVFNKDEYIIAVDQLENRNTKKVDSTMYQGLMTKLVARRLKLEEERTARS